MERKNSTFSGVIAPEPYIPHQNSCTKPHPWNEMVSITQNCTVWAACYVQASARNTLYFSTFWAWRTRCTEIRKFFMAICTRN